MAVTGKIDKRIIGCIVLIVGVVSVPLMTDYVLQGSSLIATLSQISVISDGIGKVFPIRLGPLGSLENGYGAASFQANLFYLFPAALHLFGADLGNAYKWTLLLFNLATAITSYACFRGICGRKDAGMIGSMLYTWCPYRCSEMYLVGDLGELAAWTFLPLILLGLKCLYTEDGEPENKKACPLLVLGFSLTLVSSTVVAFAVAVMTAVILLAMGKRTVRKRRLLNLGKSIAAVVLINAWFLIPALLRLRDVSAVNSMLLPDVRSRGMYFTQYFNIFGWGKDGVALVQNGLKDAQTMGPGIAVVILAALWLFCVFIGKMQENRQSLTRLLCVSLILMLLSSQIFPWDLLQNRNMFCSIVLAVLYTPAKIGIAANACLVLSSCLILAVFAERLTVRDYKWLLMTVTGISFAVTQFLLGNILVTRSFLRKDELQVLETLPFSLLRQESVIWRLSEVISMIALCGLVVAYVVRRRNIVKTV